MKLVKTVFVTVGILGFLLVLGTAGSDCDGKCMENAMPIGDVIKYSLLGISMLVIGVFGYMKADQNDY